MTKQKSKLVEMARQGNARAIAAVLNRWLQPKGITTAAKRENTCLQLRLEAERVPKSKVLIIFVRKVFASLGISNIGTVQISLYLTGKSAPIWQEEFEIVPEPVESSSEVASESVQAGTDADKPQEAIAVAETPADELAQIPSETSSEVLPAETAVDPSQEAIAEEAFGADELAQLPIETSSEGLQPETAAAAPEQVSEIAPVPSPSLDEETVTQPESLTSDIMAIPSISSEPGDREETAAGAPEKMADAETIPSDLSEEPAGMKNRWEEEHPADMPARARSSPASWLDTKMGKLLVILPIYLLALAILGIDYFRDSSSPIPSAPTPPGFPAGGGK